LLADPRLNTAAKVVAGYILVHRVYWKTGIAWPSIETISDETGVGPRHVRRAIKALQETGWIQIKRGNRQKANEYRFRDANTNKMLDRLAILKDRREEERKRKRAISERTQESPQKRPERTQESTPERTQESSQHFSGTR